MLGPYFSGGFERSTGFQVDGAGNLTALTANIGNFSLLSTGTGLTIAAPAQRATVTGALAVADRADTQYWTIGDKALTAYGGLYEVTSLVTAGGGIANAGSGDTPNAVVTLTLTSAYNGAVCAPYASYTGSISATGTLQSLTPSVTGTCTVVPSSGANFWPAISSDGSLTGVAVNVPFRVNSVVQLAPDVTQTPPAANTSVLGTQVGCLLPPGSPTLTAGGYPGVYRTCGTPLHLPLSFGVANDITLGSTIGTASATTGFTHPFPPINAAPTGNPVNPGVACAWNTSTHVLNCYDGTQ